MKSEYINLCFSRFSFCADARALRLRCASLAQIPRPPKSARSGFFISLLPRSSVLCPRLFKHFRGGDALFRAELEQSFVVFSYSSYEFP